MFQPEVSYMLNFDSPVYQCPDEESQARVDTSGVEVRSYNDTVSTMAGTLKFNEKVDSNTMVSNWLKVTFESFEILLELAYGMKRLERDSENYDRKRK